VRKLACALAWEGRGSAGWRESSGGGPPSNSGCRGSRMAPGGSCSAEKAEASFSTPN
jgi:hypothetical protein